MPDTRKGAALHRKLFKRVANLRCGGAPPVSHAWKRMRCPFLRGSFSWRAPWWC